MHGATQPFVVAPPPARRDATYVVAPPSLLPPLHEEMRHDA